MTGLDEAWLAAQPWIGEVTIPQLLDFEANHRRHGGQKEEDIRKHLGITPARYYQLLNRAIATDTAVQHDPILTHRLRETRRH